MNQTLKAKYLTGKAFNHVRKQYIDHHNIDEAAWNELILQAGQRFATLYAERPKREVLSENTQRAVNLVLANTTDGNMGDVTNITPMTIYEALRAVDLGITEEMDYRASLAGCGGLQHGIGCGFVAEDIHYSEADPDTPGQTQFRVIYYVEHGSVHARAYEVICWHHSHFVKDISEFSFDRADSTQSGECTDDFTKARKRMELHTKFDGTCWLNMDDDNEFGGGVNVAAFAWLLQHVHARCGEILGHCCYD